MYICIFYWKLDNSELKDTSHGLNKKSLAGENMSV